MEQKIETLTKELAALCGGQEAAVVIGASFNLAQSALNHIPNRHMLAAIAATLRSQAERSTSGWVSPAIDAPGDLPASVLERYEERAAILEYEAGFARPEAEAIARQEARAWLLEQAAQTKDQTP